MEEALIKKHFVLKNMPAYDKFLPLINEGIKQATDFAKEQSELEKRMKDHKESHSQIMHDTAMEYLSSDSTIVHINALDENQIIIEYISKDLDELSEDEQRELAKYAIQSMAKQSKILSDLSDLKGLFR